MARFVTGQRGRVTLTLRDLDLAVVDTSAITAGDVSVASRRTGTTIAPDQVAGAADGSVKVDLPAQDDVDQLTVTATFEDAVDTQLVDVVSSRYAVIGHLSEVATNHGVTLPRAVDALEEVEDTIREYLGYAHHRRLYVLTTTSDGFDRQAVRTPRFPHEVVAATVTDPYTADVVTLDPTRQIIDHDVCRVLLDRIAPVGDRIEVLVVAGQERPPTDLAGAAARAAVDVAKRRRNAQGRDEVAMAEGTWPFQTASVKHGRLFGLDGVDNIIEAQPRFGAIGGA